MVMATTIASLGPGDSRAPPARHPELVDRDLSRTLGALAPDRPTSASQTAQARAVGDAVGLLDAAVDVDRRPHAALSPRTTAAHGYEQSARRCCLVTDAGAGRATIARRLTLAGRPLQVCGLAQRDIRLSQLVTEQLASLDGMTIGFVRVFRSAADRGVTRGVLR